MQIIEIYLEAGEGEKGASILKELGVADFNLIKSDTNDMITVRHPLDKTDKIIARFEEEFKFVPEDRRGIIISSPDVILPKEEEKEKKFSDKSAWESIIGYGEQNSYINSKYLALFFFASVVATLGLITDNVAVVVGAMIIAPAFGPIASAAIGIVTGKMDLFRDGLKAEFVGILLAIGTAAIIGFMLPGVEMNESLRTRMYPTLFDLFVGLAAGAAGGYVLVSGKSSSVVGVMVAAALVPVMAAIGIGVVFLNPLLVLGAFLLLIVNVVSIILATVIVFWFAGPKEESAHITYELSKDKKDVKKMVEGARLTHDYRVRQMTIKKAIKYSVVLMFILAIPLAWLTYEDLITKSPEKEIQSVFEEGSYPNLELGEIRIEDTEIYVTVYDFNSADDATISGINNKIEERIDPRYDVIFNVVPAIKKNF